MRTSNFLPALSFFVLAVLSIAMSYFAPATPERWFIGGCLIIVTATFVFHFFAKSSETLPVNWLTIDTLFASTFALVHFGYFFYWIFGFFGGETELWRINGLYCDNVVCRCLAMYAACLNGFLLAFFLVPTTRSKPLINARPLPPNLSRAWSDLGKTLIRLGFAGFAIYLIIVGPAVVFGMYEGTDNKGFLPNIFYQLGQTLMISGIAVTFASGNRLWVRSPQRAFWGMGAENLALVLMIAFGVGFHGARASLMWILLAVMVAYSEYVKPISLKTLVLAGLGMIFLMGLIVAFRSERDSRLDLNIVKNINGALINFGSSAVCGFVAEQYVRENDYFYGQFQLMPLAGIVPFGRKIFSMEDSPENNSAVLLTLIINGRVGAGTAGTGTSVFADFYFDFGLWGTLPIFFLTGAMCKWAQNRSRESTSILWSIIFVSLTVYMALVSRYTLLGGVIRLVVYCAIYAWVIATVLGIPHKFRIQTQATQPGRLSAVFRSTRP